MSKAAVKTLNWDTHTQREREGAEEQLEKREQRSEKAIGGAQRKEDRKKY